MRAVVQRVESARVIVDGRVTGEIGAGLAVLVAVGKNDVSATCASMAEKIVNLRIFNDEQGKMNKSLLDTQGSAAGRYRSSPFTVTLAGSGGRVLCKRLPLR